MSGRAVKRQKAQKPPAPPPKSKPGAPAWPLVAGAALLSTLPLLIYWQKFAQLFYFHDDFLLLHELNGISLGQWLTHPFAGESIFPLFKLLWIGAVWAFGGSYLALIVLQWLTHFAICLTLGWLLLRLRLEPAAAAFAVLTFGLPSANIETLAWSIQWCSQLSMLFFLLAWHALLTILQREGGIRWRVWYVTALVASALSSSRGVVCGLVLALFLVLSGEGRRRRWLCAASLAPTVLLVLVTWLVVPPFQQSQVGHFTYSLNYLALNPLFSLIPASWHPTSIGVTVLFGALKLLAIGAALCRAGRPLRPFLLALIAFDAATAAALGYARTWTGLSTTVSSRYQYIPLLVFGPLCGILLAGWRKELKLLIFVLWIWLLAYRWGGTVDSWTTWRGVRVRIAIARNRPYTTFDPSNLTVAEARRLIAQYQLH